MILFSTRSTLHLAQHIAMHHGSCIIKQFSDGELYIRVDEELKTKKVWVIAATQPPAENMLELFFLLDALNRAGASINLFITYFGYARQIIAAPGESLSAQVISSILKEFSVDRIHIMHPHSLLLQNYLSFTPEFNLNFFCKQAMLFDAIAAPDRGAQHFAQEVAHRCKKELITITKKRPEQEEVEIVSINGTASNKKILLVDDMISTGRTMVKAAESLKNLGASSIAAAATHGVFSPGSREFLEKSPLDTITVTNTINQQSQGKINVVDISPFIQTILQHDIES